MPKSPRFNFGKASKAEKAGRIIEECHLLGCIEQIVAKGIASNPQLTFSFEAIGTWPHVKYVVKIDDAVGKGRSVLSG